MKKITLFLFVLTMMVNISCGQTNDNNASSTTPEISFQKLEHDYGQIPRKGDGTCEFKFKNTGKETLILSNVRASCGCTTPEWPKQPIKKGRSGVIKVKYDTNRVGKFTKTVTVYSNASTSPVMLKIKGEVVVNYSSK